MQKSQGVDIDVSDGVEPFYRGGANYLARPELIFGINRAIFAFSAPTAGEVCWAPGPSVPSKRSTKEMSSMKPGPAALCAAAVCAAAAFCVAPASAESRLQACNAEWKAMKANHTVGDKKYADFRKECLARTAAAPSAQAPAPGATATAPSATKAAPRGAAPPAAGEAVFPTAVSPRHSKESAGRARMLTCLDQYKENKATNANGGLNWIQKGGGYYSECNKRLKG
jgi:hypothetical protein